MKKIEAIIREERLDAVTKALEGFGYFGMTVSEVSGRGRQRGISLKGHNGCENRVTFLPKIKIEVVVPDEGLADTLDAITREARTGEVGDGKLFIMPVENAVRVRTGEEGVAAI